MSRAERIEKAARRFLLAFLDGADVRDEMDALKAALALPVEPVASAAPASEPDGCLAPYMSHGHDKCPPTCGVRVRWGSAAPASGGCCERCGGTGNVTAFINGTLAGLGMCGDCGGTGRGGK